MFKSSPPDLFRIVFILERGLSYSKAYFKRSWSLWEHICLSVSFLERFSLGNYRSIWDGLKVLRGCCMILSDIFWSIMELISDRIYWTELLIPHEQLARNSRNGLSSAQPRNIFKSIDPTLRLTYSPLGSWIYSVWRSSRCFFAKVGCWASVERSTVFYSSVPIRITMVYNSLTGHLSIRLLVSMMLPHLLTIPP